VTPGPTLTLAGTVTIQPDGTLGVMVNADIGQAELSRLVTDTIRLAEPPAAIELCEGDKVTVGAAGTQEARP
jgi:hypothetical protein